MTYREVANKIRSISKGKVNDNCYVCDKKRYTENHHLLRVADLATLCIDNNYFDIENLYIPRATLCHDHHRDWHDLTEKKNPDITLSDIEKDKFIELMDTVITKHADIPNELLMPYLDLYSDMINKFDKNLEGVEVCEYDIFTV